MNAFLRYRHGCYYGVFRFYDNNTRKEKWFKLTITDKNLMNEAQMELQNRQTELERQIETDDSLVGYLKKWLLYKKDFIERSTWETYSIVVNKHIIPYFSKLHLKLDEVKPHHIKDYYQYMYTKGRVDGRGSGLSVASLIKHGIVLKGMFNDAVLDEYVLSNPASKVKMPAKNIPSIKPKFLTADQANKVIKAFEGHRLYPIVYITLYYGLRRSEILGLRWGAIDFENNTMTINHTVVKQLTIEAKDKTKTESSCATYALMDKVKELLLKQRDYQDECRKLMGKEYKESDYVFTWEDGRLYLPDYITRSFQKVLKAHNLPVIRFHDLRHSTASILYDNGWEIKDIQLWLRHSSIDVTSDIYTHITENRKLAMTSSLNGVFDNAG